LYRFIIGMLSGSHTATLNALKGGVLNPSLTISVLRKIWLKNAGSLRGLRRDEVRVGRNWSKIGVFGRICPTSQPK
jgi:hypothetical protein